MAYKPNPSNANGVNEVEYLDDFIKNQRAIEAYKQKHGGDLEHAYQAVTGRPWPDGRSVKISHGQAEMTKDRTFKSVLGKYVAPIAAGALTAGFALPALAGAGGAAGAAGGGAGAAGAAGAGGTLAATVPGSFASTLLASGGVVAPSATAAGAAAGTAGVAGTVAANAARSGGLWGALKKVAMNPNVIGAAATGVNAATNAAAHNRGEQLSADQEAEKIRQAGEQQRRLAETDALYKSQIADYLNRPNAKGYEPPIVQGAPLPTFGSGYSAPDPETAAAAAALKKEMIKRLQTPYMPYANDPNFTHPGMWERVGQYAGPGLSIWDALYSNRDRQNG